MPHIRVFHCKDLLKYILNLNLHHKIITQNIFRRYYTQWFGCEPEVVLGLEPPLQSSFVVWFTFLVMFQHIWSLLYMYRSNVSVKVCNIIRMETDRLMPP